MSGPTESQTTPKSRTLADFYSAAADGYKRLWAPQLIQLSRGLLDRLPLAEARRVLDAGTGVGALLPHIRERVASADVVGADVSEGMLCMAPRDFPLALMDATQLGFAAQSFDVGILAFVLFHLPDPLLGLREMARVLRPDGTVGTITWGDDPSYPALDVWTEELDRHGAVPARGSISRHDLVDEPGKVESMLAEAGFGEIETWISRYSNPMTSDMFIAHRVEHGMSRYRFSSLAEQVQTSLLGRVRARLANLEPEGLVDEADVIYATGRR